MTITNDKSQKPSSQSKHYETAWCVWLQHHEHWEKERQIVIAKSASMFFVIIAKSQNFVKPMPQSKQETKRITSQPNDPGIHTHLQMKDLNPLNVALFFMPEQTPKLMWIRRRQFIPLCSWRFCRSQKRIDWQNLNQWAGMSYNFKHVVQSGYGWTTFL